MLSVPFAPLESASPSSAAWPLPDAAAAWVLLPCPPLGPSLSSREPPATLCHLPASQYIDAGQCWGSLVYRLGGVKSLGGTEDACKGTGIWDPLCRREG